MDGKHFHFWAIENNSVMNILVLSAFVDTVKTWLYQCTLQSVVVPHPYFVLYVSHSDGCVVVLHFGSNFHFPDD